MNGELPLGGWEYPDMKISWQRVAMTAVIVVGVVALVALGGPDFVPALLKILH